MQGAGRGREAKAGKGRERRSRPCCWLRLSSLAADGSASAGCWLLVPMLRWQLVASLPLATGGLTSAGMAAGGSASAGCWWLRFHWLLVPMLRRQLVASLLLATGGFTSAGNALVYRFFHRSVESMIH